MRDDREDLTAQRERVRTARAALAEAVDGLEHACRGDAGLREVASAAREVGRTLASRAKRPPPVDTGALLGGVSAAQRSATRSDAWDCAVRRVRDAESALDLAVYDLATARGEDG